LVRRQRGPCSPSPRNRERGRGACRTDLNRHAELRRRLVRHLHVHLFQTHQARCETGEKNRGAHGKIDRQLPRPKHVQLAAQERKRRQGSRLASADRGRHSAPPLDKSAGFHPGAPDRSLLPARGNPDGRSREIHRPCAKTPAPTAGSAVRASAALRKAMALAPALACACLACPTGLETQCPPEPPTVTAAVGRQPAVARRPRWWQAAALRWPIAPPGRGPSNAPALPAQPLSETREHFDPLRRSAE
jgi:hypothetical protein